jgi:hypothetical protein
MLLIIFRNNSNQATIKKNICNRDDEQLVSLNKVCHASLVVMP